MSSTPSLRYVSIGIENTIAIIKYNRPEAGNALNGEVMNEMLAAMQWAAAHPKLKVIVQSGEGAFFTTGMDLSHSNRSSNEAPSDSIKTLHDLNKVLINCEKVLIAAVNGPAAGYGASSIALFDLVYAVPDAYFFTPFVKWGLSCEGCSSITFSRVMGHQKASSLILAGDRLTAQELENAGLISKILPTEKFMDNVLGIARRIADFPSEALKFNKNLMMGPVRSLLLEANNVECEGLRKRVTSPESQKAAETFAVEQARKRKRFSQVKL